MIERQDIQRVSTQPAYILHSRNFRDSSLILDLITPTYGRVSLIARGVKQTRNSARRAILQPFRSLLVSWQGRGELCTLTSVEESGKPILLDDVHLICGYYISEILLKLIARGEAGPEVFALYDETVRELELKKKPEPLLRRFEIRLLQLLGLAPQFAFCVDGHEQVEADVLYFYFPESGATPAESCLQPGGIKVTGKTLIALDSFDFSDDESRVEAKRLMRRVLAYFLGDQPIRSRELFHAYAGKLS